MAAEKTLYEKVMEKLYGKAMTVSKNVYTSSRPTAVPSMTDFVVVSLPQGILPYSDTHDVAYVQMSCYAKDKQGGVENIPVMGRMIAAVRALLPFNDELIDSNTDKPVQLPSKTDGMGFHSTTLQFKMLVKL